MAHTAFRRDPNDEKVVLPFAREVGTPEVLRKLLVLTAADIAAVGPGVLDEVERIAPGRTVPADHAGGVG